MWCVQRSSLVLLPGCGSAEDHQLRTTLEMVWLLGLLLDIPESRGEPWRVLVLSASEEPSAEEEAIFGWWKTRPAALFSVSWRASMELASRLAEPGAVGRV